MIEASREFWHTGTYVDEFTPIYLSLAGFGKFHGPIPPPLVDQMDLSTIAALLGVGEEDARQRRAHEAWKAPEPETPMQPKRRQTTAT